MEKTETRKDSTYYFHFISRLTNPNSLASTYSSLPFIIGTRQCMYRVWCLCWCLCAVCCAWLSSPIVCFCTNLKSVYRFTISRQLFISAFSSSLRARAPAPSNMIDSGATVAGIASTTVRCRAKQKRFFFLLLSSFLFSFWISHRYASISINMHAIRKMAKIDDRRKCAMNSISSKSM